MSIWTGVFPAATTNMTADCSVGIGALQARLDRLAARLVVSPMLGEKARLKLADNQRRVAA